MIEWQKAGRFEYQMAAMIADRFAEKYPSVDKVHIEMDIVAAHVGGCPLKLKQLLEADDLNFFHDVYGINQNLDRNTGELKNFFWPRYAA